MEKKEITLEHMLRHVPIPRNQTSFISKKRYTSKLDDIYIQRNRRNTFVLSNPQCACCGARPTHVILEQYQDFDNHYTIKNIVNQDRIFTVDHRIARANKGPNALTNFQTLCNVCNAFKSHYRVPVFCHGFAKHWGLQVRLNRVQGYPIPSPPLRAGVSRA